MLCRIEIKHNPYILKNIQAIFGVPFDAEIIEAAAKIVNKRKDRRIRNILAFPQIFSKMEGYYLINYFSATAPRLTDPVTVQADIFTNYTTPAEKRETLTLHLANRGDTCKMSEIPWGVSN